jgi:hypothetical protein
MLPDFLVSETMVRESGESFAFVLDDRGAAGLILTLGITHAMEQESLDLEIYDSSDGEVWSDKPLAGFARKFYCGTYQLLLPRSSGRYLKAVWRVSRWGRGESRPLFRFYLFAQEARSRAAGAA